MIILNREKLFRKQKFQEIGNKKDRSIKGLIYVFPALVLFTLFVFYPFVKTIYQSMFLSDNLGNLTEFRGLDNYIYILTNSQFLNSVKNTFVYTLITVPTTITIALLLAVLCNENMKGMAIFRTIFTSTMGISVAAGSVFWNFIFHPSIGVLNKILSPIVQKNINWLADPKYALFAVGAVSVWMSLGFAFLTISGGLKNIDRSYYESVEIVGGGFLFKLTKVTIPLLSPTLFFVLGVSLIGSFQTFGVIDMLTQGGPDGATNLMVYNLYNEAFRNFSYGFATAQGVILFIIIFVVSKIQRKATERLVTYR